MVIEEKKRVNTGGTGTRGSAGSMDKISILNQLTMTLEQAVVKLEEAYKNNKPEQVRVMKDFIMKVQKRIGEELK